MDYTLNSFVEIIKDKYPVEIDISKAENLTYFDCKGVLLKRDTTNDYCYLTISPSSISVKIFHSEWDKTSLPFVSVDCDNTIPFFKIHNMQDFKAFVNAIR